MLQDVCQTVNKAGRKTRILDLVLSGGGRHHIINVCSMVTYPTEKNVAKRKVGNPSEVICSVRLKKGSLTDQVAFAQRNERQDRNDKRLLQEVNIRITKYQRDRTEKM